MPYPHVTQLETRLRFDRMVAPTPSRRRSRRWTWRLVIRAAEPASMRNVGGAR